MKPENTTKGCLVVGNYEDSMECREDGKQRMHWETPTARALAAGDIVSVGHRNSADHVSIVFSTGAATLLSLAQARQLYALMRNLQHDTGVLCDESEEEPEGTQEDDTTHDPGIEEDPLAGRIVSESSCAEFTRNYGFLCAAELIFGTPYVRLSFTQGRSIRLHETECAFLYEFLHGFYKATGDVQKEEPCEGGTTCATCKVDTQALMEDAWKKVKDAYCAYDLARHHSIMDGYYPSKQIKDDTIAILKKEIALRDVNGVRVEPIPAGGFDDDLYGQRFSLSVEQTVCINKLAKLLYEVRERIVKSKEQCVEWDQVSLMAKQPYFAMAKRAHTFLHPEFRFSYEHVAKYLLGHAEPNDTTDFFGNAKKRR